MQLYSTSILCMMMFESIGIQNALKCAGRSLVFPHNGRVYLCVETNRGNFLQFPRFDLVFDCNSSDPKALHSSQIIRLDEVILLVESGTWS